MKPIDITILQMKPPSPQISPPAPTAPSSSNVSSSSSPPTSSSPPIFSPSNVTSTSSPLAPLTPSTSSLRPPKTCPTSSSSISQMKTPTPQISPPPPSISPNTTSPSTAPFSSSSPPLSPLTTVRRPPVLLPISSLSAYMPQTPPPSPAEPKLSPLTDTTPPPPQMTPPSPHLPSTSFLPTSFFLTPPPPLRPPSTRINNSSSSPLPSSSPRTNLASSSPFISSSPLSSSSPPLTSSSLLSSSPPHSFSSPMPSSSPPLTSSSPNTSSFSALSNTTTTQTFSSLRPPKTSPLCSSPLTSSHPNVTPSPPSSPNISTSFSPLLLASPNPTPKPPSSSPITSHTPNTMNLSSSLNITPSSSLPSSHPSSSASSSLLTFMRPPGSSPLTCTLLSSSPLASPFSFTLSLPSPNPNSLNTSSTSSLTPNSSTTNRNTSSSPNPNTSSASNVVPSTSSPLAPLTPNTFSLRAPKTFPMSSFSSFPISSSSLSSLPNTSPLSSASSLSSSSSFSRISPPHTSRFSPLTSSPAQTPSILPPIASSSSSIPTSSSPAVTAQTTNTSPLIACFFPLTPNPITTTTSSSTAVSTSFSSTAVSPASSSSSTTASFSDPQPSSTISTRNNSISALPTPDISNASAPDTPDTSKSTSETQNACSSPLITAHIPDNTSTTTPDTTNTPSSKTQCPSSLPSPTSHSPLPWPLSSTERAYQAEADDSLAVSHLREKHCLLRTNPLRREVERERHLKQQEEIEHLRQEVMSVSEEKRLLQNTLQELQIQLQKTKLLTPAEHVQNVEVQTEHVQNGEERAGHMQNVQVQTELVQNGEVQTEHVQNVQVQTELVQNGEVQTEHVQTSLKDQLSCLAAKVETIKKFRGSKSTVEVLLEAVQVAISDRILTPVSLTTLDSLWAGLQDAQKKLRDGCQSEDVEELLCVRDGVREDLPGALETFLQEARKLPIIARKHTLEEVLVCVCGVCALEDAVVCGDPQGKMETVEQLGEWSSNQQKQTTAIRQHTQHTLAQLYGHLQQLLCVEGEMCVEGCMCVSGVCGRLDTLLLQAEGAVDQEVKTSHTQQCEEFTSIRQSLLQLVQSEVSLLTQISDKLNFYTEVQQECVIWNEGPPSLDDLQAMKKQIKTLHTHLKYTHLQTTLLEQAEELDLSEIMKKREEMAETRKTLFTHINTEQGIYEKLASLTESCFPELPLLHPDLDIHTFMRSGGVFLMSMEREMLDTEPVRELSVRRPILCTEYLGQRTLLKGYCVDEDGECKVLERVKSFSQIQKSCTHNIMPLLGLFYSKSDPLVYVMVPYLPKSSLRAVQKRSPLNATEVSMVMRGVALGLQALHSAHITHAALHPGNIFVTQRQHGIVGDYDVTRTPNVAGVMKAGSVCLVSPEVQQGGATTPASDMYSFGGLLLWLNHPDFDGAVDPDTQIPDTQALNLEPSLGSLLSKLLFGCGRLSADQVLDEPYLSANLEPAVE
ncbi:mucin-4-like isoform X2 [Engraulis encrasicolus]|uniref:mucin-4-like isoform X2 n=1 Tax=Engraulis encrasicolus TaxID=184585 RepID=UPI002FD2D51A